MCGGFNWQRRCGDETYDNLCGDFANHVRTSQSVYVTDSHLVEFGVVVFELVCLSYVVSHKFIHLFDMWRSLSLSLFLSHSVSVTNAQTHMKSLFPAYVYNRIRAFCFPRAVSRHCGRSTCWLYVHKYISVCCTKVCIVIPHLKDKSYRCVHFCVVCCFCCLISYVPYEYHSEHRAINVYLLCKNNAVWDPSTANVCWRKCAIMLSTQICIDNYATRVAHSLITQSHFQTDYTYTCVLRMHRKYLGCIWSNSNLHTKESVQLGLHSVLFTWRC